MITRLHIFLILLLASAQALNLPPSFTADMNQFTLSENTPLGMAVYTLKGSDPENSPVSFAIEGTETFRVDPSSGEVTVARPIDREAQSGFSDNEIRFSVVIKDEVDEGPDNVVKVPISVIILDENDNPPQFSGQPYKEPVNEDTPVGTTIFRALEAHDVDLVGEILEVACLPPAAGPNLCDYFDIVPRTQDTDIDMFRGSIVLRRPFNYRERQIYQIKLGVFDGKFNDTTDLVFNVLDVQNSPPVFQGSLTGIVNEDDAVGTVIMNITAKDGDTGAPRKIIYELVENPFNYFDIDTTSGQLRIAKQLDRESLGASSGVLTLQVRASELINGQPGLDASTSSTAGLTITIRDVNDEPPRFNQAEYKVSIPENVPYGTPLANLNMEIKDTDTGINSIFTIHLEDPSEKFSIDPVRATGHTAVSLKINKKLDFENPNERKFLLVVVATEEKTQARLSSSATITVEVEDLNDNSPVFDLDSYTQTIPENSVPGTPVLRITAKDRDSGMFGSEGILYELSGSGSEKFSVDPRTGAITVSDCASPGTGGCLDYEQTQEYFLSFSATDKAGAGKRSVVNLRVSLSDENDNPPRFENSEYRANIDEGEEHFQPSLFVKATDLDDSSRLRYKIINGNTKNLFKIDKNTGEILVKSNEGLRLDNIPTNNIVLTVQVSDGLQKDTATVEIGVRDVNDRSPSFERSEYSAMIPEDSQIGVIVEQVQATDADFGANAEISYRIQRGAYDDFAIDAVTGEVTLSGKLNYDTRSYYELEIVAMDGGEPSLSGSTTLKIEVMNRNNKLPYFLPSTQRAELAEDTPPGTVVLQLLAFDEDSLADSLIYSVEAPVTAINKDGQKIEDQQRFSNVFSVDSRTGQVTLNEGLDRNSVAVISLNVKVTDTSADPPQDGHGILVITIIDVNDFAPEFPAPWSPENQYITISVKEEKPVGSEVYRFIASDKDSNIARYEIKPKNRFFEVEKGSGKLRVKELFDFEEIDQKRITFDLVVYDNGIPEKSAEAVVVVNIENVNDQAPVFDQQMYTATVAENSVQGTPIVSVRATDLDHGEFGNITYKLEGTYQDDFQIGVEDGTITVVNSDLLDREKLDNLILQVVAVDLAPPDIRKSSTVPVNITITDENDNLPRFVETEYSATIVDNIPFYPEASPIVQVSATDKDIGRNSELHYSIRSGNEEEMFRMDSQSGVLYPAQSFLGRRPGTEFNLVVEVTDEAGEASWERSEVDTARLRITVDSVNTHKPVWSPAPAQNETVLVEEEEDMLFVFFNVTAVDQDGADNPNGQISYYFKVANENVGETPEFMIDQNTGELSTKSRLDREVKDHYELVIVARDHGTPVAFETLRFLNVVVKDIDDNTPKFPSALSSESIIRFTVPENETQGFFVGRVEAVDPDAGKLGRVYYYIVAGNNGSWFSIDKTQGTLYTKARLDREERDHYTLYVKASNNPGFVCGSSVTGYYCDINVSPEEYTDGSIQKIDIDIEDKNDNQLQFSAAQFFVGIPFDANVGDLIVDAEASDLDSEAAGKIIYSIKSSNLFKEGATTSSGSIVPSPFQMTQKGRVVLASLMAEFNQQRFEIDIEATETGPQASGHRTRAKIFLWVYEPAQQIKLVINKPPSQVNQEKGNIIMGLRNVTQRIVVIDDIKYHVDSAAGLQRDITDMYIHVVDSQTNVIMPPEEVLEVIDSNYDVLANTYAEMGIYQVIPAQVKTEEVAFDSNLAALIALAIVLFVGFITFFVVMCCLKYWYLSAHIKPVKLQESPRPVKPGVASSMIDETAGGGGGGGGGGTDNPLWIDQKYKAYEEQELTMTVLSDQDNSVISGNGGSGNSHSRRGSISQSQLETQSNAYATINKLPMASSSRRSLFNGSLDIMEQERDYATLEKASRSPLGPVVPGVTSTPISTTLPRRQAASAGSQGRDRSGSSFYLNQHGEPQLVGYLS